MSDHDHDDLRDLPIVREIGAHLRALAAEEDDREAARRMRRQRWLGRPTLLLIVGALLVVPPATAALSGLWSPDVSPATPMGTVTAASTASNETCTYAFPHDGATTTQRPPGAMLASFGVLRTPQIAVDRAIGKASVLRILPGQVASAYVRLLGQDTFGRERWIVPSLVRAATPADGDCPEATRTDRWFLSVVGKDGPSVSNDYRDVIARTTLGASDPGNTADRSVVEGLAPDGVRSVTVDYPGAKDEPRTWPVRRNYFAFLVRLPVEQAYRGEVRRNPLASSAGSGG